jgi:glycerophosphoryl diester phosphodiesterase
MKNFCLSAILVLITLYSPGQILFIAHRGASYYAPENTLASIKLAWELGADGAECDIYLTRDNQIVLWHDENTDRLTNRKLKICESTYKNLNKLDIKLSPTNSPYFKSQKIALLKDILKIMPGKQLLVIELKSGKQIIPELKKITERFWRSGAIAFISFSFETICTAKSTFPEIPCYWLSARKEDVWNKISEINRNKLDGVDLYSKIIDQTLLSELRKINAQVWCWTVDDLSEANRMKNLGVDAITTNRPTWLKENMSLKTD